MNAAEVGYPLVAAGIADTVLATKIQNRNPAVLILHYPNNLLFRKIDCASFSGPLGWARANINMDQDQGARSLCIVGPTELYNFERYSTANFAFALLPMSTSPPFSPVLPNTAPDDSALRLRPR